MFLAGFGFKRYLWHDKVGARSSGVYTIVKYSVRFSLEEHVPNREGYKHRNCLL